MKVYYTRQDAVAGLHKKGFTQDFQILWNDLLWVQQKAIIRAGDFTILECHRFSSTRTEKNGIVVIGVHAFHHNVKGILINHYTTFTRDTPPVIAKKIKEMFMYAGVTAS